MIHEQQREQRNKDEVSQQGGDAPSVMPATARTTIKVAIIAIFTMFSFRDQDSPTL